MDLLEGLDDLPSHRRTFKKQIDIHVDSDDENGETQPVNQEEPLLGYDDDILHDLIDQNEDQDQVELTSKKSMSAATSTPHISKFSDLTSEIIKNVQRRLNGEIMDDEDNEGEDERETQPVSTEMGNLSDTQKLDTQRVSDPASAKTQVIDSSKTQNDAHGGAFPSLNFGTQIVNLFGTQNKENLTPIMEETQEIATAKTEDIHEDEEEPNMDQDQEKSLFLGESGDETEDSAAVKEKRAAKIAERAAAKRALREQLENEKKKTAQEIDEFDDAENSKIVASVDVKKRSKKEQKILAETRRLQREVEFVPAPSKNKQFDKNKLFAAFGFGDELASSSPIKGAESPVNNTTPSTSPLATPARIAEKQDLSLDEDSDDDLDNGNVLDMLDNAKNEAERIEKEEAEKNRRALNNPLKSYEERLNDKTVDKRGMKLIELDSDPEVDNIDDLKHNTSKETRLDVKTKFVQKKKAQANSGLAGINLNKFFPNLPTKKAARGFVASLNGKAARQLKDIITAKNAEKGENEEVKQKKEGLNIEDLLEREIERNIRLKKKENRNSKETAEEGYSSDDGSYGSGVSDNSDGSDVDESEAEVEAAAKVEVRSSFIESQSQSQTNQNANEGNENIKDDEDEEESFAKPHRRKKQRGKTALSDGEDDKIEDEESIRSTQPFNNNVSFMYGANEDPDHTNDSFNDDSNEFQMGSYGFQPNLKKMLGISMTQAFESTLPQNGESSNLMENLRNKELVVIGEDEEDHEHSFEEHRSKDSFLVAENSTFIGAANKSPTIGNIDEEDEDSMLLDNVANASMPLQTQNIVVGTQVDAQQKVDNLSQVIEASQTVKPQAKRKLVRKLERIMQSESEEEEEESESDEETRKINHAIAKEKQRQKEIRRKRQLKEWKRKGVTAIVDDEASESEDEFQGLGGADGEHSDQENSEDERMLDDTSKVDLKANELRLKFAEEEKQRDENDVKKLFEDIKTGRLRRRRGGDALDLELSEDEEELKNFYLSRMNKQRNRLLKNEKIASIAANDKSRAFFETIAEKPVDYRLDDDEEEGIEVVSEASGNEEQEEEDPFNDSKEQPAKKKRKVKVSHDYITRTLSEVCDTNSNKEEEESRNALFAKYQHGLTDEVEDELDLLALKKQSSILMSTSENRRLTVVEETETQTIEEEDEEFNPIRKSSIIKSFQKYSSSGSRTGVKEVEVTISKAYKNSTGSKASIGYLANKNNVAGGLMKGSRTLKARTIEKSLRSDGSTNSLSGVFGSGNFE